jgi:hypothetical protein
MDAGGPRFIVRDGASGFVAAGDEDFCGATVALAVHSGLRRRMAAMARRQVEGQSWDRVFGEVYEGYAQLLQPVRC